MRLWIRILSHNLPWKINPKIQPFCNSGIVKFAPNTRNMQMVGSIYNPFPKILFRPLSKLSFEQKG